MTKQIIAMGGGGFSMEPDNPLLDQYILDQAPVATPKICFLATATGDDPRYITNFYTAFTAHDCHPSHLTFFGRVPNLREILLNQDIIYVGGGNTKSMLAIWREWQLPTLLRQAWEAGIVLTGVSAGAICWFTQGITDSHGSRLAGLDCLGLLPGTFCPHYDGEAERRPAFQQLLGTGEVGPGYAADDGAALHFRDEQLLRTVASRPAAKGYQLRMDAADEVVEEPLETIYLAEKS